MQLHMCNDWYVIVLKTTEPSFDHTSITANFGRFQLANNPIINDKPDSELTIKVSNIWDLHIKR